MDVYLNIFKLLSTKRQFQNSLDLGGKVTSVHSVLDSKQFPRTIQIILDFFLPALLLYLPSIESPMLVN